VIIDALVGTRRTPEGLYGRRKMTHWLRRQGHEVAFCTVDRLMRDLGVNGVRRGRGIRTTIPAKDGCRAGDLLDRDFTAAAHNRRWVAGFTYCRTWNGFTYVAFVVDVYAQRFVGWHAATDRRTDLVLTPLRIALWDRERRGAPIQPGQLLHHSDAGSQGRFNQSKQHPDHGGVDGTKARVDGHADRTAGPELARAAADSPRARAVVLAQDRRRDDQRGCRDRGRRVGGRWGRDGSASVAACRR
jgi:putative transposase